MLFLRILWEYPVEIVIINSGNFLVTMPFEYQNYFIPEKKLDRSLLNVHRQISHIRIEILYYWSDHNSRASRAFIIFIWKTRHPNNRIFLFKVYISGTESAVDCCPPCAICNTREFSRPHKHRRGAARMHSRNSRRAQYRSNSQNSINGRVSSEQFLA